MMNTARDNLIINDKCVPIIGGSFGEGLDLNGGDIDIVHVHKYIDVFEDRKFAFDYRKTYLKMETETIHAGYTMLHCIFTRNNNALQCCKKINGKYYFSNSLFKQRFLLDQKMPMVVRGPCLSSEQGDYDIAQALHSKVWISAAINWITRSKNVWPSYEVKQNTLFLPRVRRFYTESCVKYLERIKLGVSNLIRTDAFLLDSYSCLQRAVTVMQPLLSIKNPKILYLYRYSMSMLCTNKAQLIPLECACGNKYCYMNYKDIQYNLLQNIYHDAVSGWLMLVSFFYRTEQYNKAINIISNCVNVKLYPNSEMIHQYIDLCTEKSFQKRLFPLLKIDRCGAVRFKTKSTLIPQELQMEVEDISYSFPATTYTHFLCFLCHYHLDNPIKCRDSLRDLQKTITKSDRIETPTSKALSFICLGIAFQLLGNTDSAREAFHQACEFESYGVKEIAHKRLLLIK
ncbi:unnamed protein product [Mytilus coruscus]|uniref:Uncharacterized protein n=1 Tax=Mytilus coruscus TaxID=42192 RepID=A0A6J8BDZ4_MYTCO|nr:unnamed protein product [Mytilus coruscus]